MRRQRSPIPALSFVDEQEEKPINSAASSTIMAANNKKANNNKNILYSSASPQRNTKFRFSSSSTFNDSSSNSVSPLCTTTKTLLPTTLFVQQQQEQELKQQQQLETDAAATSSSSSANQLLHPIPQLSTVFSQPRFLAQGGYGRVVAAVDLQNNNNMVAVKIMNLECCQEDAQRMERLSEFGDLARILPGQDYIPYHIAAELRAHDALRDAKGTMPLLRVEIFCDYSSATTKKNSYGQDENVVECFVMLVLPLLKPLKTKSYKTESSSQQLLQSTKKLSRALLGMHSRGWLHRDLSVTNIFTSSSTSTTGNEEESVFIGDFGLAVCSRGRCNFATSQLLFGPATNAFTTIWYRSPEILQNPELPFTASNDAWSLGTVVCELALSCPLFPGMTRDEQLSEMESCLGQSGEKCQEFWDEILNSSTNACSSCTKRRELVRAVSRHLLCFDPSKRNIQKFIDALEQI